MKIKQLYISLAVISTLLNSHVFSMEKNILTPISKKRGGEFQEERKTKPKTIKDTNFRKIIIESTGFQKIPFPVMQLIIQDNSLSINDWVAFSRSCKYNLFFINKCAAKTITAFFKSDRFNEINAQYEKNFLENIKSSDLKDTLPYNMFHFPIYWLAAELNKSHRRLFLKPNKLQSTMLLWASFIKPIISSFENKENFSSIHKNEMFRYNMYCEELIKKNPLASSYYIRHEPLDTIDIDQVSLWKSEKKSHIAHLKLDQCTQITSSNFFLKIFENMKNLQSISICSKEYNSTIDINILKTILQHENLLSLYLKINVLMPKQINELSTFLKGNKKITYFYLNCPMYEEKSWDFRTRKGMQLFKLLSAISHHKTLHSLTITNTSIANEENLKAIINLLTTNKSLTYINFQNNNINSFQAKTIFNALEQNKTLLHINLSENIIYDDVVEDISRSLQKNDTLILVNLLRNQLTINEMPIMKYHKKLIPIKVKEYISDESMLFVDQIIEKPFVYFFKNKEKKTINGTLFF